MIRYYVVTFNTLTSGTGKAVLDYFNNGIERYFKKFYSKTEHEVCVEARAICEIKQTHSFVYQIAIGVAVSDTDFSMTAFTAFVDMINWIDRVDKGIYTEYKWCNGVTPDDDLEVFDIQGLVDREFEDI